jgi:DNA/RNA-binding domain of Phe-tRNA-synthetase-like protein
MAISHAKAHIMALQVTVSPELTCLRVTAIEIRGVTVVPSSVELRQWSDQVARQAVAVAQTSEHEQMRQEVRQMLRHGKFKASGRSKPAQEYLLRCATEAGVLPSINGPVDVLNSVSLQCGLPISLLSLGKCSEDLCIRYGRTGESYVFNSVGQELDAEDLVVVCNLSHSDQRPVGSPIKDSMAGKIESKDVDLAAIIYAPATTLGQNKLAMTTQLLISKMIEYCHPQSAVEATVTVNS